MLGSTFKSKTKKAHRSKVHGFRVRMKSAGGINTLKRRRAKGRKRLSA